MSSLTFNRAAAMNKIVGRLASGVDQMLSDMEGIALTAVPVGKKARESSGGGKRKTRENAVKATKINFIPDRVRFEKVDTGIFNSRGRPIFKKTPILSFSGIDSKDVVLKNQHAKPLASTYGNSAAASPRTGTFTFDFRRKKDGKSVSGVGIGRKLGGEGDRGGKLIEARPAPGNLKASIHRGEVVIDGVRVRGNLRAEANYAAPVEFGFRGAGRNRSSSGEAQPFMRPAKKAVEADWRSYFKKG